MIAQWRRTAGPRSGIRRYNERWSEADWLAGWSLMARRYAHTSAVVGFGLRNEPRPAIVGGALRLPAWGGGSATLDLAAAYERAGAAVLSASPTALVFAQGLLAGRDLRSVATRPLKLPLPGRLVYEAHE